MKVPMLLLGLLLGAVGARLFSPPPHPPANERAQLVDGKYLVYATNETVRLFQRDGDRWSSAVEQDSATGKKAIWEVLTANSPKTLTVAGSDLLLVPDVHSDEGHLKITWEFYRLSGTRLVKVPLSDQDK
jgi:hypothetical protein